MKVLIIFLTILYLPFTSILAQFERLEKPYDKGRNINEFHTPTLMDSIQIDSFIISTMNTYHIPGLSACIVRDGQIIWTGAYGYADISNNIEVTDSTLFKLASLSKPFVGTALMQLWENGLFELDEDINNYLPFQVRNPTYPNDSITFRMLLTHTSSINDNWSILVPLTSWGSDSPIPLDSFLTNYLVPGGIWWNGSNYNSWPPFASWDYTNVGATLTAFLVEEISDMTFEQYCQDSIFSPLEMNETSWFMSNLNTNNIALPYYYSGGTYHSYGHFGEPIYPAAGLRTSASQLARFIIAFMQKGQIDGVRILDSSTVDLMTTVQFPSHHPEQGLLWFIYEYSIPGFGTYTFCGHSGADYGVSTGMDFTLETDKHVGVIVLTNGESDAGRSIIWDALYEFSNTILPVPLPSGTYTIGAGGNFETIQDAFNKLSTDGIVGNVTLELIDNLYTAPADSFGFKLSGPIPGAGPDSRVTIKPAKNKNVIIEGSGMATITFLNTRYVTIDGVGITGTTTLTVLSLAKQFNWVNTMVFFHPSSNNIVQNVTIENANYEKIGIGLAFMSFPITTATADSNLIQNNFIKKGCVGIYISGRSNSAKAKYNIVRGNVIGSEADSVITWGIQIERNKNSIIENNLIENINMRYNNNSIAHGINICGGDSCIVRNNVIHTVRSDALWGSTGMLLSGSPEFGYGNGNLVYNNMVYDIQSTSNDPTGRVAGIQLWWQTNPKIYYNSVNLSGTGGRCPGGSAALFMTDIGTVTNLEMLNNIFANTRNDSPYCASSICDYSSADFTSDYNDLYFDGTNPANCLVRIDPDEYLTLSDWQATGQDLNSISEMPHFAEPYLHIDRTIDTPIDSGAIPITGIYTDFDGEARLLTTPDIGADEFVIIPVELISFSAIANRNEVILNWSTATELNNLGFDIQRSTDRFEFITLGFVNGHGTTTERHNYNFSDRNLTPGNYWYRLKQIDFSGKFEYSDIMEIKVMTIYSYLLEQNYPNPFNPVTRIGYGIKEKCSVKITVLNSIGQEVAVLVNEEKESGYHSVNFNAGSLSSGVYFYQLKAMSDNGEFISVKKMILLK